MKILTRHQVHWSKYLSAFNLVIHFCPKCLGTKPDALTRQWDIYSKEGRSNYATVNPHNFHPSFSQEQLTVSLCATHALSTKPLVVICTQSAHVLNIIKLHNDIHATLPHDPTVALLLPNPISVFVPIPDSCSVLTNPPYTCDSDGFVCQDG